MKQIVLLLASLLEKQNHYLAFSEYLTRYHYRMASNASQIVVVLVNMLGDGSVNWRLISLGVPTHKTQ